MSKVEHRKLELVLNPKQLSASYQVLLMSPNCRFRVTLSKLLRLEIQFWDFFRRWKISHDKEQQISESSRKIEQSFLDEPDLFVCYDININERWCLNCYWQHLRYSEIMWNKSDCFWQISSHDNSRSFQTVVKLICRNQNDKASIFIRGTFNLDFHIPIVSRLTTTKMNHFEWTLIRWDDLFKLMDVDSLSWNTHSSSLSVRGGKWKTFEVNGMNKFNSFTFKLFSMQMENKFELNKFSFSAFPASSLPLT